jgi:hypothetical protein
MAKKFKEAVREKSEKGTGGRDGSTAATVKQRTETGGKFSTK